MMSAAWTVVLRLPSESGLASRCGLAAWKDEGAAEVIMLVPNFQNQFREMIQKLALYISNARYECNVYT